MSKQAVMMVVDVGSSMDVIVPNGKSRLGEALDCAKLSLQNAVFNNSANEIGLVIFGDDEAGENNS